MQNEIKHGKICDCANCNRVYWRLIAANIGQEPYERLYEDET